MKTEKLIQILKKDLSPVTPVSRSRQTLIFSVVAVMLLTGFVYFRTSALEYMVTPSKTVETFALLFLAVFSVYLAIRLSIPGEYNARLLGVVLFLGMLWGLAIFGRYFTDFARYENPQQYHGCMIDMIGLSLPLLIFLVWLVKHNYPVYTNANYLLLAIAAISLAAFSVEWICPDKSPLHMLKIHYLTAVVVVFIFFIFRRVIRS